MKRTLTLSVSSLLDRFLRHCGLRRWPEIGKPFSILAVGSFPQTSGGSVPASKATSFSILAVGSFPQTLENILTPPWERPFQYPRCWIVSSDVGCPISFESWYALSVSSLLDRFLRHTSSASIITHTTDLSVSSLLDRFLRQRGGRFDRVCV